MTKQEPPVTVVTKLSGNRKSAAKFFTLKSARHYAKQMANAAQVEQILIDGTVVFSTGAR